MKYKIGIQTHVGMRRSENQDAFVAKNWGGEYVVGVFDGMGGHPYGRETATAAAQCFKVMDHPLEDVAAHASQMMQVKYPDGGTTAVVARIRNNGACHIFHVGDSRVYLIGPSSCTRLTVDHSVGHMLRRALGTRDDRGDHAAISLKAGDTLLLCTDGLHGLVEDSVIAEEVRAHDEVRVLPGARVQRIVAAPVAAITNGLVVQALRAGGGDNVTVAVVQCLKDEG